MGKCLSPFLLMLIKFVITKALNNDTKYTSALGNTILNTPESRENSRYTINDANRGRSKKTVLKKDFVNMEDIEEAVKLGKKTVEELTKIKEPLWFQMGLFLKEDHPASKVALFGKPSRRASELSNFGLASLEATKKITESLPGNLSRRFQEFPSSTQSRLIQDSCPLRGRPPCLPASRRYRTSDGTCNNLENPWRGSAMQPMQRFLPPSYEDGIQSIRRSALGPPLPSARKISQVLHGEKDNEMRSVTMMFVQWGQFIDHDITSSAKSRGFNGSVPRCCDRGGRQMLPPELMHPACLPIEIPLNDPLSRRFGVRCMEFTRSAPSTRINCDFGWREQINQATAYIDASTIYGSDVEISDSVRLFQRGRMVYGPIRPRDFPEEELCNSGALTANCFQPGDSRVTEQPGLTALHTVWVRFHNRVASMLSRHNSHWSDEKVFQETRKIVCAAIQHITYREFLPIVLGPQVMDLFELNLENRGYYTGYDSRVDPGIANSFSAAAYRFGHSMVQNSYLRTDSQHRPLPDNVSLHNEADNDENIWSTGSVDRLLLGFCNQPSQRRDEFICSELSNHLFQSQGTSFGMDLPAINIQRGRDHGIPPYTAWRKPCGLSPIGGWRDLEKLFSLDTMHRFKMVYLHVDDIDLFSGGLAEKPVRGGVVGPTFACIIAQQFSNLRKGDRFWYENRGFDSSFTPAQLQQIKRITLSKIFCQTTDRIRTLQPYVFLAADDSKNARQYCDTSLFEDFDLTPWVESTSTSDRLDFARDFLVRNERSAMNLVNFTIINHRKQQPIISTSVQGGGGQKKKQPLNNSLTQQQFGSKIDISLYHPTEAPSSNHDSIEINIKINHVFPTTTKTTTTKPTSIVSPPDGDYTKNKVVLITSRPFSRKPIGNSYQSPPPTTPVSSPIFVRPQYDQDVVVISNGEISNLVSSNSRPSSGYHGNFPISTTKIPPNVNLKPSTVYYRLPTASEANHINSVSEYVGEAAVIHTTGSYLKPNVHGDYHGNFPKSTTKIPPNVNWGPTVYYKHPTSSGANNINSISGDVGESAVIHTIGSYLKPNVHHGNSYHSTVFEEGPFSSSNRPVYYENNYSDKFGRPFDKIDDVYSQLLVSHQEVSTDVPKRPNFGPIYENSETTYHKISQPIRVYSADPVQKYNRVVDKFDFKTMLRPRGRNAEKLVKLYSLRSTEDINLLRKNVSKEMKSHRKTPCERHSGVNCTFTSVESHKQDSSDGNTHRLIYNETVQQSSTTTMPIINRNMTYSKEYPHL